MNTFIRQECIQLIRNYS